MQSHKNKFPGALLISIVVHVLSAALFFISFDKQDEKKIKKSLVSTSMVSESWLNAELDKLRTDSISGAINQQSDQQTKTVAQKPQKITEKQPVVVTKKKEIKKQVQKQQKVTAKKIVKTVVAKPQTEEQQALVSEQVRLDELEVEIQRLAEAEIEMVRLVAETQLQQQEIQRQMLADRVLHEEMVNERLDSDLADDLAAVQEQQQRLDMEQQHRAEMAAAKSLLAQVRKKNIRKRAMAMDFTEVKAVSRMEQSMARSGQGMRSEQEFGSASAGAAGRLEGVQYIGEQGREGVLNDEAERERIQLAVLQAGHERIVREERAEKESRVRAQQLKEAQEQKQRQLEQQRRQLEQLRSSQFKRAVELYVGVLRKRIEHSWTRPKSRFKEACYVALTLRKNQGDRAKKRPCTILVRMADSGNVLTVEMLFSSSDGGLDQSLMVALKQSSPLPPLPAYIRDNKALDLYEFEVR